MRGEIYGTGFDMNKAKHLIIKFRAILPKVRPGVYASALSFHITMTFFPLLICLYTLLGNSFDRLMRILDVAKGVLAEDTLLALYDFAEYVANNNSPAMMAAAILVLMTSASAATRMIHWSIGKMQGGDRYRDIWEIALSFVFSVGLLATMYFAVIVMFTGKSFITYVNRYVPFFDISKSWYVLRYILLGAILFVLLSVLFATARRKEDRYSVLPGSICATVAVVITCFFFSAIISKSSKYSLVYGSLASLILLMLWLYWCCFMIIYGAALNVAIRDTKAEYIENVITEERKKNLKRRR